MKKIISKGYTITVTSWENDADNYNTKSITVDTKEEAKMYYDMMQLFQSKNNQSKEVVKLGNVYEYGDFSSKQLDVIYKFVEENPALLKDEDIGSANDDQIVDWFMDIAYNLLGGGEFYSRVMESCTVTYSPEDVFLEEIKF